MLTGQHKIKQSAERVAEQTLPTQKMFANFSPFRIPGVTGSELYDRPGYIPVLPFISSMILSKLLNFFVTLFLLNVVIYT